MSLHINVMREQVLILNTALVLVLTDAKHLVEKKKKINLLGFIPRHHIILLHRRPIDVQHI